MTHGIQKAQSELYVVRLADYRIPEMTAQMSREAYADAALSAFNELVVPLERLVVEVGGAIKQRSWLAGAILAEIPRAALSIVEKSYNVKRSSRLVRE